MPVYNRADLLPLTLRSLLRQSHPAMEILIVDDGSDDGSAEVAESFGPTVRVIRQKNAGPAAARNRGFQESKGEFIHFFDSDDVALPNKHEVQLKALEESGADIAYGPWVKGFFTEDGFEPNNLVLQQKGLPSGDLVKALLSSWSVVPHACLFRREIVEQAGGFPEDLWVAEDQMMFLNCLLEGAKVVHSPGTLELYRSDNVGKISDNRAVEGRNRHLSNWARFLIAASERCQSKGIDTCKWFGFRQRVAVALHEFQKFGIEQDEVEQALREILDGGSGSWIYQLALLFETKRQGLSARLGRGRAHPSFRIGRMTDEQIAGMNQWSADEAEIRGAH